MFAQENKMGIGTYDPRALSESTSLWTSGRGHVKKNVFEPQSQCLGKRVLLMCICPICAWPLWNHLLIVGTSVYAVWDWDACSYNKVYSPSTIEWLLSASNKNSCTCMNEKNIPVILYHTYWILFYEYSHFLYGNTLFEFMSTRRQFLLTRTVGNLYMRGFMRTTQTTTIVSAVCAWYSFSTSASVDSHNSKQLNIVSQLVMSRKMWVSRKLNFQGKSGMVVSFTCDIYVCRPWKYEQWFSLIFGL